MGLYYCNTLQAICCRLLDCRAMFFWNPESEAGTREMGADFAANEQKVRQDRSSAGLVPE